MADAKTTAAETGSKWYRDHGAMPQNWGIWKGSFWSKLGSNISEWWNKPFKEKFSFGGQAADAAKDVKPEAKGLSGMLGNLTKPEGQLGMLKHDGFVKALDTNLNFFSSAGPVSRGMKALRAGGTGVGVVMAGDALFRGKKSDGESRGTAGRVLEFVVGGGVAAGSALTGAALHARI